MKKLLLIFSFLFLWISKANAISSMSIINIRDYDGRSPNIFVSEAVYRASHTAVVSTNLTISTKPVWLEAVIINTKGIGGSFLDLFNARQDTTTTPQITQFARIDTSTNNAQGYFPYHLHLSSGSLANNQGSTPADATIIYLDNLP